MIVSFQHKVLMWHKPRDILLISLLIVQVFLTYLLEIKHCQLLLLFICIFWNFERWFKIRFKISAVFLFESI